MNDVLEAWVMHDRKPMSARLLAVKQRIHIKEARRQLQSFLDGHAKSNAKPYATWVLMGEMTPISATASSESQEAQTQDSKENVESQSQSQNAYSDLREVARMSMLLTDDAHLDAAKGRFTSTPSVQLYALNPPLSAQATVAHRLAAISTLSLIQHDLKSDATYIKTWNETDRGAELGAIRAPSDIRQVGKDPIPPIASTSKTASAISAAVKKEQPSSKDTALPAKAAPAKAAKGNEKNATKNKNEVKAPAKPKRKLVDSEEEVEGKGNKGPAAMDVDDDEEDGPIGYADVSADRGTGFDKDEAEHKRADAGDKRNAKEDERRRRRQELIDMMDDDGDQDPDVEMGATTSSSIMKGSKDMEKRSANTSTSSTSKNTAQEQIDNTPADSASGEKPPKRRVRKQRKVIRKETTRNEKGYRVTRDVEEYESYSSDESTDNDTKRSAPSKVKKSATNFEKERSRAQAFADSKNAEQKPDDHGNAQKNAPEPVPQSKADSPTTAPVQQTKKANSGVGSGTGPTTGAAVGGQRKLSSFFTKKK